jgi:hypothetical protein
VLLGEVVSLCAVSTTNGFRRDFGIDMCSSGTVIRISIWRTRSQYDLLLMPKKQRRSWLRSRRRRFV